MHTQVHAHTHTYIVSLGDNVVKSHQVYESVSPIYDAMLHKQVALPTKKIVGTIDDFDVSFMVETTPRLKVEILDGETLIGRAFVSPRPENFITKKDIESEEPAVMKRVRAAQDAPPEPAWSELLSGGDSVGEVLIYMSMHMPASVQTSIQMSLHRRKCLFTGSDRLPVHRGSVNCQDSDLRMRASWPARLHHGALRYRYPRAGLPDCVRVDLARS